MEYYCGSLVFGIELYGILLDYIRRRIRDGWEGGLCFNVNRCEAFCSRFGLGLHWFDVYF